MNKFDLVIKNPDGSVYWRQGFENKKQLNAWLDEEKTRPYWKKEFEVSVTDNSAAIEEERARKKAEVEAIENHIKALRANLREYRKNKNPKVADVALALAQVLELMGIEAPVEDPAPAKN